MKRGAAGAVFNVEAARDDAGLQIQHDVGFRRAVGGAAVTTEGLAMDALPAGAPIVVSAAAEVLRAALADSVARAVRFRGAVLAGIRAADTDTAVVAVLPNINDSVSALSAGGRCPPDKQGYIESVSYRRRALSHSFIDRVAPGPGAADPHPWSALFTAVRISLMVIEPSWLVSPAMQAEISASLKTNLAFIHTRSAPCSPP